ncbi:MAG: DUF488 domain-containing protein [Acidobacteria bacterium]|nr:DUF488 domain-containing protein [Acidobacteriota bacterium]
MEIQIKRAYEAPSKSDGFRVLVDRLWPRGISKEDLSIKMWAKSIAPSSELRKWFNHDPSRWSEFSKRYRHELKSADARHAMEDVLQAAQGSSSITLVYGAKDTEHNQAVVLQSVLHSLSKR